MRFWGGTNPHETIEGPKSKEKVIAWVGLSYECGVIGRRSPGFTKLKFCLASI